MNVWFDKTGGLRCIGRWLGCWVLAVGLAGLGCAEVWAQHSLALAQETVAAETKIVEPAELQVRQFTGKVLNAPPERRQPEVISDDFGIKLHNLVGVLGQKNPQLGKRYDGPRVPIRGRAISMRAYTRTHAPPALERARARLAQAGRYLEAEKNSVFTEILSDIIRQYHFSQEAARAAFALAQFYEDTETLKAVSYYVYVVNLHIHADIAEEACYRLAVLLERERYYTKSEELMEYLLQLGKQRTRANPDVGYMSQWTMLADKWLRKHYTAIIRWGDAEGTDVKRYRKALARLNNAEEADAADVIKSPNAPAVPNQPQLPVPTLQQAE